MNYRKIPMFFFISLVLCKLVPIDLKLLHLEANVEMQQIQIIWTLGHLMDQENLTGYHLFSSNLQVPHTFSELSSAVSLPFDCPLYKLK